MARFFMKFHAFLNNLQRIFGQNSNQIDIFLAEFLSKGLIN